VYSLRLGSKWILMCVHYRRRVRLQAELKKAQTTAMQIDLGGMRRKLNRGILRFRKIQQTYMPAAIQVLGDKHLPSNVLAEDVPLLLPSALSEAQRALCAGGVEHVEALMRDAQCRSGLARLRNQLHIKSRLLTYKKHQVRHQGANTRSQTIESLRWSHPVPPDGSSGMRCRVATSFGDCSVACSLWCVLSAYYLTEYYCFLYLCRRPFLSLHFAV
jgi:hypothetical protein